MCHGNLNSPTEVSTELEITNKSDEQFENKIQLDGYTKEFSNKLSSTKSSSSSQRQTSENEETAKISRDSLSYSVLSQMAKKPLDGTPRTSTPELQTSVRSPRHEKQNVSGVYRKDTTSEEESTRKHLHDSVLTQENLHRRRPILQLETTELGSYRDKSYKSREDWYFDILQRIEDLSWNYQKLETEYDFLERFKDEQKEDLKKVKNCSSLLKNRADLNTS